MQIEVIEFKDLTDEKLNEMVNNKVSFHIKNIGTLLDQTASELDRKLTARGLKTRVYVSKRLTTVMVAGALMPVTMGISGIVGAGIALAAGVHNLCTINPDYEISKYIWDKEIVVTYKKYISDIKAEIKAENTKKKNELKAEKIKKKAELKEKKRQIKEEKKLQKIGEALSKL